MSQVIHANRICDLSFFYCLTERIPNHPNWSASKFNNVICTGDSLLFCKLLKKLITDWYEPVRFCLSAVDMDHLFLVVYV